MIRSVLLIIIFQLLILAETTCRHSSETDIPLPKVAGQVRFGISPWASTKTVQYKIKTRFRSLYVYHFYARVYEMRGWSLLPSERDTRGTQNSAWTIYWEGDSRAPSPLLEVHQYRRMWISPDRSKKAILIVRHEIPIPLLSTLLRQDSVSAFKSYKAAEDRKERAAHEQTVLVIEIPTVEEKRFLRFLKEYEKELSRKGR